MQSVLCRGSRIARLGRPIIRRRPPLLRPIAPLSSVSTSAEHEQSSKDAGPDKQSASRDDRNGVAKEPVEQAPAAVEPAASEAAPATIDVESTPVVALVAQPSTTEVSSEEEQGREEAPQASFSSHPIEDLPEEVEEDIIASKELVSELMDGKSFGKRGEQWLFAQLAAMAMLIFPPLTLKGLVDFCATLSLTAGLVFMLTALVHLGRNLSPLPEPRKKHELVVSGIYGYVRHPMYGGLLLAALGLAVLTRNETRLAICALLWWVLESKVVVEERALSERYPEYAEYKAKVKKFFPFLY